MPDFVNALSGLSGEPCPPFDLMAFVHALLELAHFNNLGLSLWAFSTNQIRIAG
jgi:hypothetical protein